MAEKLKITEGPWVTDQEYDHPGDKPRVYALNSGKLICEVGNAQDWTVSKDEWEENARAIASLPSLIEAAEMAEPALVSAIIEARKHGESNFANELDARLNLLRSALNKINGGE